MLDEIDRLPIARFGENRRVTDLVLDELLTSAEEGTVLIPAVDRDDMRVAQRMLESVDMTADS